MQVASTSACTRATSGLACGARFIAKFQSILTRSTFAVTWYRPTRDGVVSIRAARTASANCWVAHAVIASMRASLVAKRRCTVVLATPAASAICSTVAAGLSRSTRSAASRIVRTVRSASARRARAPGVRVGWFALVRARAAVTTLKSTGTTQLHS